jgi:hypothetical protein
VLGYKAVVGRTGPLTDRVLVGGHSFPSGHVATAVVCWGLVAWLAADFGLPVSLRRLAVAAVYAAPAVTGIGMLLLDYHWLSDLVAGAAVGTLLLRVVHAIFAGRLGDFGHAAVPGVVRAGRPDGAVLAGGRASAPTTPCCWSTTHLPDRSSRSSRRRGNRRVDTWVLDTWVMAGTGIVGRRGQVTHSRQG